MAKAVTDGPDVRFERKFAVSELTKHQIETIIRLHPAMFSEIYHQRFVNNLYFDSASMECFSDAVDGHKNRLKIRIRWYGPLLGVIARPTLELKVKMGLLGSKEQYPLAPFCIDREFQMDTVADVFRRSDLAERLRLDLLSLEVSLLNRYSRRYFQSADRKYRITVDTEMEFYRLSRYNNSFLRKWADHVHTVVELKYGYVEDEHAARICSYFPFRLSKNSKYVSGIQSLEF